MTSATVNQKQGGWMLGADVMSEMGESGEEELSETQGLEEDEASRLRSAKERNGGVQTDSREKEKKPGMFKSLRESFKQTPKRNPLSPNFKDHLNTEMGRQNIDPEITSPTQVQPPSSPNPSYAFTDSLLKKADSLRRSFRFNKKDKTAKMEQLQPVTEASAAEKKEVEVEKAEKGIRESYTLPEIPPTPLSVMQINKLIEMEALEKAHLNLLSLRLEFQQEKEQCLAEASPLELAKKEKDLSLLYRAMQDKVKSIARNSNSLPSRNKELLVDMARIIQEEERREGDPGGLVGPGGWRGAWREAVSEGVQAKLGSVHLDGRELNASWLAVHLGLLGETIVEDLENVKRDLQGSYPPSFNVFSTYVSCYHAAVGQHLKKLLQQVTDLKDYYALLDWIIHRYESERIMGSPSLCPEMEGEDTALCLEQHFLEQLKSKYCRRVQEDMKDSLGRILTLEDEEMWKNRVAPESDDDSFLHSHFHMDIWTKVQSIAVNSKKIDVHLEKRVVLACFEELKQFPKRFECQFEPVFNSLRGTTLGVDYQITYINTFVALKEHMDSYKDSCPTQVDLFSSEADGLVQRLVLGLENQFKNETKPFLRRMMTRKWLTADGDFQELYCRTEKLFQQCVKMRSPHVQKLVSNLHYHLVKEYVSQLMKNNYSCKNRKHERASKKMRGQWSKLRELFQDMKTDHEWLHPIGDHLCDIIGQKNKRDIKNHLQPLVKDYPDISRSHLAAVLYFRGVMRGREKQAILQCLTQLTTAQAGTGHHSHSLFAQIEVPINTDCLADMPFSCLSFLLPDS
ncbi:exocyst complex component 3-like protein 4 isoform X1 [Osmerus eperlanus]|uniref:exocyst complex component 3-like protein 4 isoform X1 n=2 Tax=Osmerus eperlanus TaxID=29151 RepID=UPI002E117226